LQNRSFFLFTVSCLFKLKDISRFVATVDDFQLLPASRVTPVALLIVGLELSVLVLLFHSPLMGLVLASVLLISFTGALASVIGRQLQVQCNCLGNQHSITAIDLVRNLGFLGCSCGGAWLTSRPETTEAIALGDSILITFMAVVFMLILSQWREIYQFIFTSTTARRSI
jgi:hypothetical protein